MGQLNRTLNKLSQKYRIETSTEDVIAWPVKIKKKLKRINLREKLKKETIWPIKNVSILDIWHSTY